MSAPNDFGSVNTPDKTPCCRSCTWNRLRWSGCVLTVLGAVLIGIAMFIPAYIQQAIHGAIIDYQVLNENARSSNTDAWQAWSDFSSPKADATYYNVYIYNTTNPDAVVNGAKPNVNQVGPYVFREIKKRFNTTFGTDSFGFSTMVFREWVYYVFDADKSAPLTLNDNFTTPNMVMQGLAAVIPYDTTGFLSTVFLDLYETYTPTQRLFTRTTANGLLFGWANDTVLLQLHAINPSVPPNYPGVVQNQTTIPLDINWDGIYTGEDDVSRARSYFMWKNMTFLQAQAPLSTATVNPPLWGTPDANRVHGTDATTFPPYMPTDKMRNVVETWVSDLNRTAPLRHTEDVEFKGIKLQRFRIESRSLLNTSMNPANAAFYMNGPSGVLDLSECNQGLPIFLTKPHMVDVSPSVAALVTGQHPSAYKHDTFIDVEPTTGVTMHAAKRLQVNVNIKPLTFNSTLFGVVTWFPNINNNTLLPISWMEEYGEISDSSASDFKNQMYVLTDFANASYYAFYVVGNVFLAMGIWFFFAALARKTPPTSPEVRDPLIVAEGRYSTFGQ